MLGSWIILEYIAWRDGNWIHLVPLEVEYASPFPLRRCVNILTCGIYSSLSFADKFDAAHQNCVLPARIERPRMNCYKRHVGFFYVIKKNKCYNHWRLRIIKLAWLGLLIRSIQRQPFLSLYWGFTFQVCRQGLATLQRAFRIVYEVLLLLVFHSCIYTRAKASRRTSDFSCAVLALCPPHFTIFFFGAWPQYWWMRDKMTLCAHCQWCIRLQSFLRKIIQQKSQPNSQRQNHRSSTCNLPIHPVLLTCS